MRWAFTRFAYAGALILAAALTLDLVRVQWARTDTLRDSPVYWQAAENVRDGGTIYGPLPPKGPHVPGSFYIYPPPFAAALSLMPRSGYVAFARGWMLALIAALWGTAACLGRIASGRWSALPTLAWGAALACTPGALFALNLGQVDVVLWCFVALALAVPAMSGVGFMATALIKPFGVWPLAAGLLREDRGRVAYGAGAVAVLAALVTLIAVGPAALVSESAVWLRDVLPTLGQGQLLEGTRGGGIVRWALPELPQNLSIPFLFLRPAVEAGMAWAPGTLLLLSIVPPLAVAWWARRLSREWHLGFTLAAALVCAPIMRPTSLPMLLPLAAVWWRARQGREPAGLRRPVLSHDTLPP